MEPSERQAIVDAEHLRILAICYYVSGGMAIFFASFALLYVALGLAIAIVPAFLDHVKGPHDAAAAALVGYLIAAAGGLFLLAGWTIGGLTILAARSLQQRHRRVLTLVVATFHCLWVPIGTVLGILTFIVLLRPSVTRLYEAQAK